MINFALSLIGIEGPGWLFDPDWAMTGIIMTTVWKDIAAWIKNPKAPLPSKADKRPLSILTAKD